MKYVTAVNCMYALLALGSVWVMLSLFRRSRDPKSNIHLDDLLLGDDGKISRAAVVMMGAFMLSCWMMIYLLAAGKMTEGYVGLFLGAWVAPNLANKFAARSYTSYNQGARYGAQPGEEPPVYNREETYR